MLTIRSDSRQLTTNAQFSYLTANYVSGTSSFVLTSVTRIAPDDYLLFGEFGSEESEILQVSTVTVSSRTVVTTATSKYAHPQDTKVSVLPYNKVRFCRSTTSTDTNPTVIDVSLGGSTTQFDITNTAGTTYRYTYDGTGTDPLITTYIIVGMTVVLAAENFTAANNGTFEVTAIGADYFEVTNAAGVAENNKTIGTGSVKARAIIDIETDDVYTKYYDRSNTTGYGYFAFYNSTTNKLSSFSNPIPYAGFELYSVKKIFDSFFSLLNNSERRLITDDEAMIWLNEAYARTVNELNLVNTSYMAASDTISATSGTAEYALESDFSDVISVTDSDGVPLDKLDMNKVAEYRDGDLLNTTEYYLIGSNIGFVPTPTSSATYTVYYKKKAAEVNSYDDLINFPDNQFYLLVDYMIFRASIKLRRPKPEGYYNFYQEEMKILKISAHKQDNKLDSWEISQNANT